MTVLDPRLACRGVSTFLSKSACFGNTKSQLYLGITAAMPGGSFLGALASGFLSDTLGRRKAIMLGPIIW